MAPNSNTTSLENLVVFWQLVTSKARFNLRSEATQSYLSYTWWLLEPLLQMGGYLIISQTYLPKTFSPLVIIGQTFIKRE